MEEYVVEAVKELGITEAVKVLSEEEARVLTKIIFENK